MPSERSHAIDRATSAAIGRSRVLPAVCAAVAAGVFVLDANTPPEIAFAVLYVGVVLLSARFLQPRGILIVALGCMALTLLNLVMTQQSVSPILAVSNRLLSLAAIGVTTFLAMQNRSRETVLREQADLLDLTHDTIFVRDMDSVILYWNRGAEELYGWKREEAVGQISHQLLQTIFPKPLEAIVDEVRRTGRWEGELVHTTKDGTQAIVASRWSVQQDARSRPVAFLETNNDITERKQAEEAARRSELELREVVETVPAMVWTALPDGNVDFVNRRWQEFMGLSPEDALGRNWEPAIHPDDQERCAAIWRESLATGRPIETELRLRRPADGAYRWFSSRAAPLRDETGTILKWCGVLTDIEDRKRAEDALRRSEYYLAEAQRLSHIGSWAYNPDIENSRFWSEETFRIYGLDPRRSRPPDLSEFSRLFHPDDRDRVLESMQTAYREKVDNVIDHRIVLPDGTVRHLHVIGHPVLDDAGAVVEHIGTVMDVTERKRAEEALQRSERYLTEAQRLSHTGCWVYDPATRHLLHWSEELFRIHGMDPRQSRPPDMGELIRFFHPDDRDRVLESIETAVREKTNYVIDHRIVLPDGTVKHLHVLGRPVFDDAGAIVEYVGAVTDVTERKRAEEALHQAQAELAHVTRVTTIGALTSSIAHEVNQPLAAIVASANAALRWLAAQPPNLERARETMGRIVRDGHRASEVIGRVRALLKKTAAVTEQVDLNDLIQETVAFVQGEVSRHRILLRTELTANLPPVSGDRVQLQQVLLNLVLNGIDAMKEVAERPRELLIQSRLDGSGAVLVAVQDTGVGLDPQHVERVFEAFYTTKTEGMGMGLAICRSIIEVHGGRLWASAGAPRGAVFQFTLPPGRDETSRAEHADEMPAE